MMMFVLQHVTVFSIVLAIPLVFVPLVVLIKTGKLHTPRP